MIKLTQKQKELVELIKNKQNELGEDLYFRYFQNNFGMCLVKLIENNTKIEVVEKKINSKVMYALLDKGILVEKKINENVKMIALV